MSSNTDTSKTFYKVPFSLMQTIMAQLLESTAKIKDGVKLINDISKLEKIEDDEKASK